MNPTDATFYRELMRDLALAWRRLPAHLRRAGRQARDTYHVREAERYRRAAQAHAPHPHHP